MEIDIVYNEDCLQGLKRLPDNSVDCCVTSPPYYALRDYGCDGQIGLEETPQKYIEKLTEVFMEVFRVLKEQGTLWLNIGDSYWGGGWRNAQFNEHSGDIQKGSRGTHCGDSMPPCKGYQDGYKPKDLIGIPWMLAFSLRNAGWYLRQDIIWHKPNPMPESVTDRCTKSHEYIFLLSKSKKYYFDNEAIQEQAVTQIQGKFLGTRGERGYSNASGSQRDCNGGFPMRTLNKPFGGKKYGENNDKHFQTYSGKEWKPRTKNVQYDGQTPNTMHLRREQGLHDKEYIVRNKRDVWSVNLKPDKAAHFATYPEELILPCILAGCPKDGLVLDPFMGSGTTARVARHWGRHYIGFELNPTYIDIIRKKSNVYVDMFAR